MSWCKEPEFIWLMVVTIEMWFTEMDVFYKCLFSHANKCCTKMHDLTAGSQFLELCIVFNKKMEQHTG